MAISNPPKRKGDMESPKRTGDGDVQSEDGAAQPKSRSSKDDVTFVRPTLIPRLRSQDQAE